MSTKTLKSTFRRSGLFVAAFALIAATLAPAASTYADALNPLTERSLTLSSSSPGWSFNDASGNPTFAPPNSGANGNKTGNTFSFRVSSAKDIKGFDFQYCTTPAGDCMGPGNITNHAANAPAAYGAQQSDLEIKENAPSEIDNTFFGAHFNASLGQPSSDPTFTGIDPITRLPNEHAHLPNRDDSDGNFIVLTKRLANDPWTASSGWAMDASVKQTLNGVAGTFPTSSTNKNNYISLVNTTGEIAAQAGDYVKVIFFATDTNYIINPGNKEFFVKINTFNTDDAGLFDTSETSTTIIDGGVTVANVMNRSIEIQTKVLETMDFSVGTVDPNTLDSTDPDGAGTLLSQFTTATGKAKHTTCDPVVQGMDSTVTNDRNVLKLGNETGEFSLRTDTTYSTHSYWRLSSNSSGGATVYYSGITLSNTVGDQIDAIGASAEAPAPGSEQFGLALDVDTSNANYETSYTRERDPGFLFQNGADNDAQSGVHSTLATDINGNLSWHTPQLFPLAPKAGYGTGKGNVNAEHYGAVNTQFAFDPQSTVIPTPFADGTQVLDCATGKMRYIANIAATTPAGVYTTKINYIASPKY